MLHDITFGSQQTNSEKAISELPQGSVSKQAKCKAIDMKMIFYSHANKTYFHHKGFAVSLVLKVRVFGACKGPNNKQIQLGYYATLFSL